MGRKCEDKIRDAGEFPAVHVGDKGSKPGSSLAMKMKKTLTPSTYQRE